MEIQRSNLSKPTTPIDDDNIPDCLLYELLLRLPFKSVVTCKIVSKRWLSLASDPSFIQAYAARASSLSQPHWILLSPFPSRVKVSSDPSPSRYIMPPEIYLQPRLCEICLPRHEAQGLYAVVGVSNGLLLYHSREPGNGLFNFYVYNPITGYQIKACKPIESRLTEVRGWGFLTCVDGEFVLRSYRIVRVVHPRDRRFRNRLIFNVYYSEIDEWKDFTVVLSVGPVSMVDLQEPPALLDGILHWTDVKLGVIAYDPDASPEQMRLIRYPPDLENGFDWLRTNVCAACGGELKLIGGPFWGDNGLPGFSIWKLQGGSGEWTLEHKVQGNGVSFVPEMGMVNAFFDPRDSDVVFFYIGTDDFDDPAIFSCDLKSGTFDDRRKVMILDDGRPFSLRTRAFPSFCYQLVVPPWPTHLID